MRRSVFRNYIVDAVLVIVLGSILLVRPQGTIEFIIRLFGLLLLIMGIARGCSVFLAKKVDTRKAMGAPQEGMTSPCADRQSEAAPAWPGNTGTGAQGQAAYEANAALPGGICAAGNGMADRAVPDVMRPDQTGRRKFAAEKAKKIAAYKGVSITIALIQVVLGIWLLAQPEFFVGFFPFVAGIIICYGAVLSFIAALRLRDHGIPESKAAIVLSVITIVLGVIIILHPVLIEKIIIQVIGISLLIEGITLLLTLSRSR